MGRDLGVELPRPGALDDPEQAGLGEFAERVVDRGAGQFGELGARLLEDLLGAQMPVCGAREQAVDRPPLSGGA